MEFFFEDRLSDSPYIEGISYVRFETDFVPLCRADGRWELVVKTQGRKKSLIVAGPMTEASAALNLEGSEYIVIKFKFGTYMPYLPARNFLDAEMSLPEARSKAVWLSGSVWQLPDYNNVETFVNRLVHEGALARDRVVEAALQDHLLDMPVRTVRHRFLRITGLTQGYIRRIERARHATALLEQGVSILDTVHEAGYSDQPHLTPSLKHFIRQSPAAVRRLVN